MLVSFIIVTIILLFVVNYDIKHKKYDVNLKAMFIWWLCGFIAVLGVNLIG